MLGDLDLVLSSEREQEWGVGLCRGRNAHTVSGRKVRIQFCGAEIAGKEQRNAWERLVPVQVAA